MSEFPEVAKLALRIAAGERMRRAGYGISPCPTEPTIHRRHIDGPYLSSLDGQIRWLSLPERLLTKLGIWTAWDIEWRRFPLPAPPEASATLHGSARGKERPPMRRVTREEMMDCYQFGRVDVPETKPDAPTQGG